MKDELLAAIVAGNVEGDIRSPMKYGCIARLVTNQNSHVVGQVFLTRYLNRQPFSRTLKDLQYIHSALHKKKLAT
jgi:hypothetical protein